MDAQDLFRKLGAGAKFDFKKFGKDAERFKVIRSQKKDGSGADVLAGIDFFGTGKRDESGCDEDFRQCQKESGEEVDDDGSGVETDQPLRPTKRKRGLEAASVKICKKKKKKKKNIKSRKQDCLAVGVQQGDTEIEGIQWTSSIDRKVRGPGGPSRDKSAPSLKKLKHLHQEKVNRIRHQNRIHVRGTDLPDPMASFEELQEEYKLDPRIIQNLQAAGFQNPTPIQMQAIPLMLHRREILACAPTGSGKTVAFCLPILAHLRQPANRGFRALIISPTRELASQTHRELLKLSEGLGFRVHIIDKGGDAIKKYGPKSAKKFDVLVTTPNRLIFLLKQDPPTMDLSSVEWLVVDESDKLFEDGRSGFREQLATIFLACSSPHVRRALFSATFTMEVEEWCRLNLDNLVSVNVGPRNSAVDTVDQELLFVGTENGKLLAMRDLIKKGFLPPVLVFVQSIERARELFHELVYEGINVDVIHAERTQQQRDNVVTSFRAGKIWVLICTALLARGIDFKGVNLVINYDFPTSAVEYIHRIGRTGRAGHKGKAITFFTEDDKPLLRSIANVIKQAGCPVPDYMIGFKKMHSKLKRQLQKRPPRRTTIRTMPRFLRTKGGASRKRRKKGKASRGDGEQATS
ncbi:probable ATP-dependent RNA helicase DDX52 [Brienomyrus brachyistius]|uniref:probable ATP-dependent RNA helicase DDX52 n=1 Tax=Brienomyrus brachyistius TaxID=42636 RepID=UPI0020B2ACBC|nr:probable ATP-dependent RNA helicase DDX52 [Brienomyrus brachyistius]